MPTVIDRSETKGQWRYTCPRGHTQWSRSEQGIWCAACHRAPYIDDVCHETIVDQKTGTELQFSEVCIA